MIISKYSNLIISNQIIIKISNMFAIQIIEESVQFVLIARAYYKDVLSIQWICTEEPV